MSAFPHLTDTESVRAEAHAQYGGLQDAAAFQEAHRASLSPDVEAAALRKVNPTETQKVQDDLGLAQSKIDAEYGDGEYRVLDAAVRGDALSVVAEDRYGRPQHLVVGWNDRWRSIAPKDADARANAGAEAAKGRLGAEARAEVARQVAEATDEIMKKVSSLFADKNAEVDKVRHKQVEEAAAEKDDGEGSSGSRSSGSRKPAARRKPASRSKPASRAKSGSKLPNNHDDLDKLAAANGVSFDEDDNVKTKQDKLSKAGVKPPEE
jgi:hypothetical protein